MRTPGTAAYRALSPGRRALVVALVLGLVVGLAVAPFAYEAAVDPAPDRIAVVPIVGTIDGENAADVTQRLIEARLDGTVEAVVLVVNSPGGIAAAGEEVFMQVDRTAQEKPVVAVSDTMAASAGYKAVLPADEFLVKPPTIVGSVGTIFVRPDPADPSEPIIQTGPRKQDLDTPRGHEYSTESAGNSFVAKVVEYRGEELAVDEEELAHARTYTGVEAVELGIADGIGDAQRAIQVAADRAGLETYQVRTMNYGTEVRFLDRTNYAQSTQANKTVIGVDHLIDAPGDRIVPQVLMLPHAAVAGERVDPAQEPAANRTAPEPEAEADG